MEVTKQALVLEVEKLLRTFQPDEYDFSLLAKLGLAYTDATGQFIAPTSSPDLDLATLGLCIRMLFTEWAPCDSMRAGTTSLLGGISSSGCWSDIISTENGAYLLAKAVLEYVGEYSRFFILDVAVKDSVIKLLNTWVAPVSAWVSLPGQLELCQAMFSQSWCDIALPDSSDLSDVERQALVNLVGRDRPPFRDGLCRAKGVVQEALPSNVGLS